MICQNCHSEVDNDPVFSTNCGARLHETVSQMPTAALNDSVATKDSTVEQTLSESDYVLILVNQNKRSSTIQSDL